MRKADLFLAAAAVLLLPPAPAFAQIGVETEAEAEPADEAQAVAVFRQAVAGMRTAMMRPGERVEDWDQGGADPDGDLRALGAERFYQVNRGVDGTGVTILSGRPIRDFAPEGWTVVDSFGEAGEALDNAQVDFMPFSERYVVAARSRSWRQNDARCYRNISHALLFEVPGAPASPDDALAAMTFRMIILAMEDQTICTRSEGDRAQGYRTRYFLPDGRILPELTDANDLLTIVPAAPVDTLIRAVPPRRTTTD